MKLGQKKIQKVVKKSDAGSGPGDALLESVFLFSEYQPNFRSSLPDYNPILVSNFGGPNNKLGVYIASVFSFEYVCLQLHTHVIPHLHTIHSGVDTYIYTYTDGMSDNIINVFYYPNYWK